MSIALPHLLHWQASSRNCWDSTCIHVYISSTMDAILYDSSLVVLGSVYCKCLCHWLKLLSHPFLPFLIISFNGGLHPGITEYSLPYTLPAFLNTTCLLVTARLHLRMLWPLLLMASWNSFMYIHVHVHVVHTHPLPSSLVSSVSFRLHLLRWSHPLPPVHGAFLSLWEGFRLSSLVHSWHSLHPS